MKHSSFAGSASLGLLALALIVNVVLGPLGLGVIHWRVSPNALNQTYGADAVSLVLVVPTALLAAWFWQRGHRLAAPLALGVGLATLYYAIAEILGGDYLRYPGNNERFSLLFLALVVLSWTTAARAWTAIDSRPPRPPRWLVRGLAVVLVAGATIIGLAWTAQLVELAATGTLAAPSDAMAYADSPSAFWTVRIVDLGFIVPVLIWTGVGLWRESPAALRAAFGVVTFMSLQAASVLAMGAVMLWRQDPTATPTLVYALTPITAAFIAATVMLLRSYAVIPPSVARHPPFARASHP